MTLQEVGDARQTDATLLAQEWHSSLNLAQLAAYIRYEYIRLQEAVFDWDSPAHSRPRPYWDGGRSPDGVKHKSIWDKIARAVRSVSANPGVWIAAHFSGAAYAVRTSAGKGTIASRPELLASELSQDVYAQYVSSFQQLFFEQFESARVSLGSRFNITAGLGLEKDDHFYLSVCDATHVNASPFLRHAFSNEFSCARGIARYLVPAALEYDLKQPLYEQLICEHPEYDWLVSESLYEKVLKFRAHWSTYE
jgi:hypothetical protein